MDISRLKKKNLKVWLFLMEGVEVCCRHIAQSEFDAIDKAAVETRIDPKTRRKVESRDEKAFRSALARAVVQDWRGIKEGDQDYPCTPENIDYLMEDCTEFRLLVLDAPLSMEKMLAAEKGETEKNFKTTSTPASTIQE
jgi:hypothetical protein